MAPSRRKSFSKAASDRRQWKIGDLVLAKVKGFPAWPAMVSEPDKWGYSADWKKVFVYFFGTEQIGFCNHVDVEEFTEEKKESLLVRRHGKGADFVRALNEIIDCFDKLKKQSQDISANCTDEVKMMKENNSAESSIKSGSKEDAAFTLKSHLKTPVSSGSTHDLNFLTEAAVAEDGLHNEDTRLEDSGANCTHTDKPSLMTYSTRSNAEVSLPEKGVSERRTSARRSRGSSRIGPQDMTLSSSNNTRSSRRVVTNALRDTFLRRSKRIMKLPDDTDGHEMDSYAFVSNDNDDENDSDTVTVSDNLSCDDSSTLDSGCKPKQPESVVDNCEGETELNDRLDFQTNTVIIKKKRKPNRKRHGNDTAELVARLDRVISEAERQKIEHLPSNNGKSAEKCTKEDGDEHLPLVKRARIRMGRPSPSREEPGSLAGMEEKLLDVSKSLTMQSPGPLNSMEDGSADSKPVYVEGDSDNLSVFDSNLSRKPQSWESRKNFVDGEAALPPSKRLHRALEAMSANAAEDSLTVSEGGLSTVNTSTNGCCCSSPGGCPELSMVSGADIQPIAETAEGADGICVKDSSYNQNAKFNIVEPDLKPDSPNTGEKHAHLDCTSSTDHCETECSELAEPFKESHADITQSSDTILVEEIAVGSPQNDADVYLDKGCSKGDKTSEMQNLLLAETNQENRMPELEKESALKDPSATPMKVMTDSRNQQLSHSNSSFDDHLHNKTVSFTQTSSSVTDGLDSVGLASPPSSAIRNLSKTEKNSFLESNSHSPDVLLPLDKAKLPGKSSSEANNALSSFETILGSLTRTKESIGRATRIAIDCAKFGFATKVVELLSRNLENESSLSRRVDLFFLIDSITQCSRGMKGDGGIYPSAIQPLLPRLLFAAAPPGSSHENHKQCLKVLRVWHERKILPEPIIRHHIQELDAISNSYLTGASSRRPLRNERAFDDPIRQMEGMPVDEYGSNSSFQLPGFCMPPMLRDEDGGSDSDGENFEAVTPEHDAENVDGERNPVPAVEKRRHILEDVDGELEMEDVAPACETEINSISNITGVGSELMSNHESDSHFGAPFAPPLPKDIPPSPPQPRSPCPSALPPAMPDSVSHGSDWKLNSSFQKTERNIQDPLAKQSILPNISRTTSDAVHHHSHDNRNFETQMPRMSDFTNSCSFSSQPGSHPSARASNTVLSADGAFNKGFHLRPPHPSPTNQFSFIQDQRMQSRRDAPVHSYHNRFPAQNAGNGNFYRDHDGMKFAPHDNIGEYWRPPFPSVSGPCYPESGRMPRAPISYNGPPCEPPLPNNRWACPPQPMNHRQFIHYRQPSEGPIPVANRGPNFWRPRRAI